MMQIKFNFNNFMFCGVCLPQLGSVPAAYARLWLAYPIMTSFRYVPYVACVLCVALAGSLLNRRCNR